MIRSDLLRIPRREMLGRMLERCQGWPLAGAWAVKLQRVRRKRFLADLKGPRQARAISEVLRQEAGRSFEEALNDWLRALPGSPPLPEPPPIEMAPPCRRASVIINTVDRGKDLELTLMALRVGWDSSRDELIVVLGPTQDGSETVLHQSGIPHQLIHCSERNLSVSRNLGLSAASGRFVVFLDDDSSPEPGWLDALLAPLECDPDTGVSAGFVLDGSGRKPLNRYVVADALGRASSFDTADEAREEILRIGPHRAFLTATGCNMAFHRAALAQIGGFDPAYRYFLEETDVVRRLGLLGLRCQPAPQSLVRHRLGSNLVRQPEQQTSSRLVLIRSQFHYIRKFGKTTFAAREIETCIWLRVLGELERIAWAHCDFSRSGPGCAELQHAFLRAVTDELRLDSNHAP